MKKLFLIVILANFLFMGYVVWTSIFKPGDTTPTHLKPYNPQQTAPPGEHGDTPVIRRVNQKNRRIRAFHALMNVDANQDGVNVKLTGELSYEKSMNFRQKMASTVGNESDIGSNPEYFWFWSKRLNPPALHYAHHSKLHSTRLKTPFHPIWMMESLSMNEIDLENGFLIRNGENIAVVEERTSASNRQVIKITLVDPRRELIIGHYIFEGAQLSVSSEVEEFTTIDGMEVPKRMKVIWLEEKVSMVWNFEDISVNRRINPAAWQMPNMRRKINMGEEAGAAALLVELPTDDFITPLPLNFSASGS